MRKCTKCDQMISGVHYELVEPGAFSGGGSKSFIAVVTPCNHVIGVVPALWEAKIDEGLKKTEELTRKINSLEQNVNQILYLLSNNR